MKTILILLLAAILLSGFRVLSPEEAAKRVIRQNEENFAVQEHAELYRYVRVTADGKIYRGDMLIIFRYNDDFVSGVFRLLPDDDNQGVTLISHQVPGETPRLSHYDDNTDSGGLVDPGEITTKLGDTDWFFEGIFDDDKNSWSYRKIGVTKFRGHNADVIQARYNDPALREATGYDHRKLIVRRSDGAPLSSEFYNDRGEIVYLIDLLDRDVFEFRGEKQVRTRQLQLTDFEGRSSTIMTRLRSNWDPQLPSEIFDLDYAGQWDAETDQMIISRLHPPGKGE